MIDFIAVLQAQQQRDKLTQADFAEQLQISESYLSLLYNRKRQPGVFLLSQVRKRYSHLASEIDLYLLGDGNRGKDVTLESPLMPLGVP